MPPITMRAVALVATLLAAAAAAAPATAAAQAPTLDQLIRAEDRRGASVADDLVLRRAASSPDTMMRRMAVRAMGRQERPALIGDIAPHLGDAEPAVRAAAAVAVAQAAARGGEADRARALLVAALGAERDAAVRGAIAESMGRLPTAAADVPAVARRLAAELPGRGAVRGLYFLARQRTARGQVPAEAVARLRSVVASASLPEDVRATAAAARMAAGGATESELAAFRRDPSPGVRAVAADAGSITDPDPLVRYRALARLDCDGLAAAVSDPDARVWAGAVEALARCAGSAEAAAVLRAHPSSRAVVSLATVAPAEAAARVAAVAASADPFARVNAARAARVLADTALLRRLAGDADPNVRSEAIDGLHAVAGHAADSLYAAALESDAPQLLMSAARALGDSTGADERHVPVLVRALDRVTALRRETSRDARMALVEALGARVPARYAGDFDPVVAARAAALAGVPAAPRPLPPEPVPTAAELRRLERATIEMADGGRIELRLLPFAAPTNAWRFARLARAGYYDGLTFHRVVPFFVVQGGSPLANEYAGDGPFTRDELGVENRRGTVGLSTRGRDTGDGQFYVNTVDNVRLDHDYTVFAEVVRGMEVVDRLEEGARIRRIVVH